MAAETTVSVGAVRRLAIAAQGYAGRYRRASTEDVALDRALARLARTIGLEEVQR